MSNRRQSVRSNPLHIQPFLLNTANTQQKEGILEFFQDHHSYFFIKYTGNMVIIGTYMVLSRPFDSFQDHCIYLYNFNILAPNSTKPSQTGPNMSRFKFSNFIVSIVPIVHPCEQIWQSVKNTLKSQ